MDFIGEIFVIQHMSGEDSDVALGEYDEDMSHHAAVKLTGTMAKLATLDEEVNFGATMPTASQLAAAIDTAMAENLPAALNRGTDSTSEGHCWRNGAWETCGGEEFPSLAYNVEKYGMIHKETSTQPNGQTLRVVYWVVIQQKK